MRDISRVAMLNTPLLMHVERSGFTPVSSLIHLFIGAPEDVLGLKPQTHFVWSTASDERRNGPDDVDLTLYSLHKWAAMAARGNATALHFIFASATASSAPIWESVQSKADLFLSKASALEFLGFAGNQLRRITGEMGKGAKGTRPEYECAYGYDAKAAMHCLRLYFECIELMGQGRITLPRPERELLIEVRSGAWSKEKFVAEAERCRLRAEESAAHSNLPEVVDRGQISRLIADVHLEFWKG
jgi:uncharacterized protein